MVEKQADGSIGLGNGKWRPEDTVKPVPTLREENVYQRLRINDRTVGVEKGLDEALRSYSERFSRVAIERTSFVLNYLETNASA